MDFRNIYDLSDAHSRSALHVNARSEIADPLGLASGKVRVEEPIVFDHHSGKRTMDLVGTTNAAIYLLSDRIVNAFRDNRITGWTTFPIAVYGKTCDRIDGYHGLSVVGSCGKIDNSRSQAVWKESPSGNRYKAWLGMYFDPRTWDGSDIFCPQGTGYVFVVEKVKVLLEGLQATNLQFKRLSEVERLMLI